MNLLSALRKHEKFRSVIELKARGLADAEEPDIENAIKEGVSAVEALAKVVTGEYADQVLQAILGQFRRRREALRVILKAHISEGRFLFGSQGDVKGGVKLGHCGGAKVGHFRRRLVL